MQTNINRKHFAKLQIAGQQSTANCRPSISGHWTYWIFDECHIIYLFEQKSSWLKHFYGPRRILWLVRLPCQQYRFQTGLFNRLEIGIGWIRSICISVMINIWGCHIMFRFRCLYNGWCRQSLHKLIQKRPSETTNGLKGTQMLQSINKGLDLIWNGLCKGKMVFPNAKWRREKNKWFRATTNDLNSCVTSNTSPNRQKYKCEMEQPNVKWNSQVWNGSVHVGSDVKLWHRKLQPRSQGPTVAQKGQRFYLKM